MVGGCCYGGVAVVAMVGRYCCYGEMAVAEMCEWFSVGMNNF